MPIEDLSRCVYSPGCSSVGTQCSPTPLYENVDNFGEMLQALRSNDMLDSSNQNIASVHSVVKHDIVSSLKSIDDDRRTPYNTVDSRRLTFFIFNTIFETLLSILSKNERYRYKNNSHLFITSQVHAAKVYSNDAFVRLST